MVHVVHEYSIGIQRGQEDDWDTEKDPKLHKGQLESEQAPPSIPKIKMGKSESRIGMEK